MTIAKAYYHRVLYCAWGLVAHYGWERLNLDRQGLIHDPNNPQAKASTPVLAKAMSKRLLI